MEKWNFLAKQLDPISGTRCLSGQAFLGQFEVANLWIWLEAQILFCTSENCSLTLEMEHLGLKEQKLICFICFDPLLKTLPDLVIICYIFKESCVNLVANLKKDRCSTHSHMKHISINYVSLKNNNILNLANVVAWKSSII